VPARFLVLPSPLLGPVSYQPLAEALRGRGHRASVAECGAPIRPERLVDDWSAAAERADVLIAHSNAGYLAADVSANVGGRALLFMDAALPPASGPTMLAPPEFLDVLRDRAGADGRLPPWTRWWPAEDMAALLPGPWFERVDSAAPHVDLAYFETELVPPTGWSAGPCGYLAFGTTYAAEVKFARGAGWPVAELTGHHLWHLADPVAVAKALDRLDALVRLPDNRGRTSGR
jgi:hypothetical protein